MSTSSEMTKQVNNLARLAKQKAHLEAVRRLQLAFEQELRDAGVKGPDVQEALGKLNAAIGFTEDKIGGEYDNTLFEMGSL